MVQTEARARRRHGNRQQALRRRELRRSGSRWPAAALSTTLIWLVLAVVVVASAVGLYLADLDQEISSRFEGRRWSLPARIYAAPMPIYPGLRLSPGELVTELRRLGYRRSEPRRGGPEVGRFRVAADRIHATLREFRFADAQRPVMPVTVIFDQGRVSMVSGPRGPLPYMRLEPPLIGSFFATHGEDRMVVAPGETPPLLIEALKAVEDRHFDSHPGFDIRGILRAFWVNLRSGEYLQGGSTLTQQLVRSYYLDNSRTLARKLKEVAMAVILDARFEKADLMNAYINEIPLGQDGARPIHGFGLGSHFYFNKPLLELDDHEIALLIAVIRGPSHYNPYRHPRRAKLRRDRVLVAMRDAGLIDQRRYAGAIARGLSLATTRRGGRYYPAFMDLVREQLRSDYHRDTLAAEGLAIHTTLDARVQETAEAAVAKVLTTLERDRQLPPESLEAAVVVRASQTGDVRAVVGGRRPGRQGFNRVLNGRRTVGSLIKPFVYLAAIESRRFHLASPVADTPLTLPQYDDWSPRNINGEYRGSVPLVRALGDSLNVATVHVGLELGIDSVAARIGDLTGRSPAPYPSLLLGAYELSPLAVSELYGVLAGGGFKTPAQTVTAVVDDSSDAAQRYPIAVEQAIAPADAGALTRALQIVMDQGTGRGSPLAGSGVAGKTGTSDDYRDSWFAGYDANSLIVAWIGRDDNLPHGLSGAGGALVLWSAVMIDADADVVPAVAASADLVAIDYATGLRAEAGCGVIVNVPLPAGTRLPWKPGCRRDVELTP